MRRSVLVAITVVSSAGLPALAQVTDPPARVGRIAAVSGVVSFHLAGDGQWERASINLPLTDGAAVWTQPGAAATIGLSGNRIVLDSATELDVDKLDEHALATTQPQGDSYWRLPTLPSGDSAAVQTPRGTVVFGATGRYEVISGDTDRPTEITVVDGSATVVGLPANVAIGPNQTLTITGDGSATPFVPTLHSAVRDAFVQRMLASEQAPVRHVALPPAVALMTGSEILSEEGSWSESADYGPVWYPPVAPAEFVPYRDGHWAYVAPWGWTWVDAAPWGFAPSHYGRWAEIDRRWGWVPGRSWAPEQPPVYAPALVAFIAGAAAGSWVGWVPLGPHDEYRPAYHTSPRFVEALNRPTGATTNLTIINRQAVTIVPAQAMVNSTSVARAYRAGPPLPANAAPALQFQAPVTPTHATVGATPAVLRDVAPREVSGPERPAAPGPAFTPGIGSTLASPGRAGAALLGGAALGGAAGALLHPAAPHPGFPELRPHGEVRSTAPGAPFTPPPSGPVVPEQPRPPQAPAPAQLQPERRPPFGAAVRQSAPVSATPPAARTEQAPGLPPRSEPGHGGEPRLPVVITPPVTAPARPAAPDLLQPRPEPPARIERAPAATPRPEPAPNAGSRLPVGITPPAREAAPPPVREAAPPPRPEPAARPIEPPRREPAREAPRPEPVVRQAAPPRPEPQARPAAPSRPPPREEQDQRRP